MGDQRRSMELKVGAFLLLTTAVLVAFILVLGNFRFAPGFSLTVNFPASGGLREGAKVKIAGMPAGKVKELTFVGGEETDSKGQPVWVRARIELDAEMARSVTDTARFFITTEGMLGEMYVEITPGEETGTPLADGAEVAGERILQLQLATARAMKMFEKVEKMLGEGSGNVQGLVDKVETMLDRTNKVLEKLDQELPALVEDARGVMSRASNSLERLDELAAQGKEILPEAKEVDAIVLSIRETVGALERQVPGMLDETRLAIGDARTLMGDTDGRLARLEGELVRTTKKTRRLLDRADSLLASLDGEKMMEQVNGSVGQLLEQVDETGKSVGRLVNRTDAVVAGVSEIVSDVKKGKGTLGAFLVDREIYDDVRELILDLKRNPWKVLYKP